MRSVRAVAVLAFLVVLAACSGHTESASNASASPGVAASPEASASDQSVAVATSGAGASPAAEASVAAAAPAAAASGVQPTIPPPSPNPNLLAPSRGTVLRSYSPAQLDDSNDGNIADFPEAPPDELSDAAKPPYTFVFEFPGVATITEFSADPGETKQGSPPANVVFSVSTTGPDSGFTDVATIARPNSASPVPVSSVRARWVRVVANGAMFRHLGAAGTIAPLPHQVDPSGLYSRSPGPTRRGAFRWPGRRPATTTPAS
jgi:hypothetical protein